MIPRNAEMLEVGTSDKLEIIEALWNSIPDNPAELPMPDWLYEELDRREVEFQRNPDSVLTWEEVKLSILNRQGE